MYPHRMGYDMTTRRGREGLSRRLCQPGDKCVCGHYRANHAGYKGKFSGACSVCADIRACAQFRLPIKKRD